MNEKGFSLVDLMVCSLVITILSVVVYPCISRARTSFVFNEESRILYGNLQNAKIEAIKGNAYVVFQLTPLGYTIFVDDGANSGKSGDWERQAGEIQLVDHQYKEGVALSETTFTLNRTRFNGRVGMKAGRVILSNSDGLKTQIVISTIGRVRIEKI